MMATAFLNYLQLTKPRIMLLIVASGAIAIFMEGSLRDQPLMVFYLLTAVFLTGGSANTLNQYFERDIDAKMSRTKDKRILVQEKISASGALFFSIFIGSIGLLIFGLLFNWYSALISLGSILYYSFFYTLWLKPHSDYGVVIGGASGAIVPVGTWVAASGEMALAPWILFLIIFLWTPPHFWVLALRFKEDYVESDLPMLPITRGEEETAKQIFYYSISMVLASFTLYFFYSNIYYLVLVAFLGILFIQKSFRIRKQQKLEDLKDLFRYSILYLFLLFGAIVLDDYLQSLFV